MPELPEVEIARRCLERWARGKRVERVIVREPRVLGKEEKKRGLGALSGARFAAFDRKGKHLLLTLRKGRDAIGLWSHLGMTGKWLKRAPGEEVPRFSRVELQMEKGPTLHYADMRLFGRLRIVPGAAFSEVPELAALGPDPLRDGIDLPRLRAELGRIRQPIKIALLDQGLLAGVGNIHASEALHRAALDPRRRADSLRPAEVARLARGIAASIDDTLAQFSADGVVRRSRDITYVEEPGTPNPFRVYGRAGEPCPRCKRGRIVRIVQGARATFYCPACQR